MRTGGRRFVLVSAIALACGSAGCTPTWFLLAAAGADRDSSAAPPPPALEVTSSVSRADLVDGAGQPSASEIRIAYRLSDPTGGPAAIDIRWRLASEPDAAFRPASPAPGTSGPGRIFVWAA